MPDLRVVAERSAEEIKKQDAIRALKAALVELTANLLRIVRGAGKSENIGVQLNACAAAFNKFLDAYGRGPRPDELAELEKRRYVQGHLFLILARIKAWVPELRRQLPHPTHH
jgi:hypothetical protein